MAHIVTEITSFDNKRNKVTLDYGEVTFLLYKGECRKLGLRTQETEHNVCRVRGRRNNADSCCIRGDTAEDDLSWLDGDHNGYDGYYHGSDSVTDTDKDNRTDSRQNIELSEAVYRSIIEDILLPRAKKRVLYYLKSADKTREQIRRKLREGYYPDEVIDETFKFLDRYGFADDDRYAEQYVEELRGSKSRREISLKLKERGISRERAEAIIAELDDEDEYTACEKALKKKYSRGISREDRQKAYAYLARRGFSYEAIDQAIRSLALTDEDISDTFA